MDSTFAGSKRAAIALAFALVALPAAAQTLYKLIDKNGKITYSEEKPKNFDGQVVVIEVDPNRNTATLPKYESPKAPPTDRAKEVDARKSVAGDVKKRLTPEQQLQEARDRLENARKAFADARDNPREGDIRRLGKVGGGTRPVPTEEYQARVAALEAAVKAAEDEVQKLERAL
jgi:exonuclease VII small subunit